MLQAGQCHIRDARARNRQDIFGLIYGLAVAALFPISSLTMSETSKKYDIDLRGTTCPMAFVKLRLFVDQMPNSATITVLYEDSPANEPLARSTLGIGHEVVSDVRANEAFDGSSVKLKVMSVRVRH